MFTRTLALAAVAATAFAGSVVAAPQAHAGAWDGKVVARSGVVVRSAPTTAAKAKGTIRSGKLIPLACKVRGPKVDGNDIWYLLPPTTGEWVSARYVANVGNAPDWCSGGAMATGRTTTAVAKRTGPSTSNTRIATVPKGKKVSLICKVRSQNVSGNSLWYWTSDKRWVSARYVRNVGATPGWCTER